jgi:ABC-type sugar transport system substrate-binding protein
MKKKLIPVLAAACLLGGLVGCNNTTTSSTSGGASSSASTSYDFKKAISDGELGYVILVGEDGNPEAIDRTAGCVAALNAIATEGGFKAVELERHTCVDSNGNKWNDAVAQTTVETWVTKYAGKLDFIVSNNDGMAIKAAAATGLQKGTPIVGFDALGEACNMIKAGTLAGSVSQNGDDQALATVTVLKNLIEGNATAIDSTYGGKSELNLTSYTSHIVQTKLSAVTKANADSLKPGAYVDVTKDTALAGKKLLFAYYAANDNFISETFRKALPHYAKALGFEYDEVMGDGNSDTGLQELVSTKITGGSYDGYAFNIITHSNWEAYKTLAGSKPIVFFNRQPKKADNSGVADLTNESKIYFVGSGSTGQGTAQGQIIKDWYAAVK